MKNMYKILSILIVSISYFSISKAQEIPSSFADLAEKLMPSVVNISTTTTVTTRSNPLPFEFPQVHHLKICLALLNKDKLVR